MWTQVPPTHRRMSVHGALHTHVFPSFISKHTSAPTSTPSALLFSTGLPGKDARLRKMDLCPGLRPGMVNRVVLASKDVKQPALLGACPGPRSEGTGTVHTINCAG